MDRRPRLSVALPPSLGVVEHAKVAERLGYERVWLFDSPALYTDIWMALARVAEATDTIGLGTGVAIPSLRHPMVTASAIAGIEELTPGRLVAAFGTGYSGRIALGRTPMRWDDLSAYVRQLRGLLDGEVVEIEGRACQMIHSPGYAPPRPIGTPLWLAPSGPKGFAAARALGVGGVLVPAGMVRPEDLAPFDHVGGLMFGTVVRPGEDHTSRRLLDAAGPGYVTSIHGTMEHAPAAVDGLPGGAAWRERIEAERPEGQRHLAIHEGHLCFVTDRDTPLVAAAGEAILQSGWTGDAASIAARLDRAAADGYDEILYMAAGPDIAGELEALAAAAGAET